MKNTIVNINCVSLIVVLTILITSNSFSQLLTLYQAIHQALKHNETIMYSAHQNYLSAQAQLNVAESA